MTRVADIPIPKRMREMQRDPRGYPIPYTVMREPSGRAHFTINNHKRQKECIVEKRCTICGKKLAKILWFVGGPVSAFHEHGAYLDTAMHQECMTYALQVCPFLAMPKYLSRIETGTLDLSTVEFGILMDETMIPERPEVFVAVAARSFAMGPMHHVRPARPYLAIQYWRHGVRLPDAQGMLLGGLVGSGTAVELDPVIEAEVSERIYGKP